MPLCTAVKAFVACMLLASLAAPGRSHADTGRPPRDAGSYSGRFLEEEYAERLGLEAETLAAIHTIVETARLQNKTLWTELQQAHAQMLALPSRGPGARDLGRSRPPSASHPGPLPVGEGTGETHRHMIGTAFTWGPRYQSVDVARRR